MFDCPEHTHTSPTSTSLTVSVFLPFTVSAAGLALAGIAGSFAVHLPEPSALALAVWSPKVTVTGSFASAVPHTGTAMPCWRTMWSPNSGDSFTSARADAAGRSRSEHSNAARTAQGANRRRFIGGFPRLVRQETCDGRGNNPSADAYSHRRACAVNEAVGPEASGPRIRAPKSGQLDIA